MTDVKEHHEIEASDGDKDAVVAVIGAMHKTAKKLPEGKRYDVTVEIKETNL